MKYHCHQIQRAKYSDAIKTTELDKSSLFSFLFNSLYVLAYSNKPFMITTKTIQNFIIPGISKMAPIIKANIPQ